MNTKNDQPGTVELSISDLEKVLLGKSDSGTKKTGKKPPGKSTSLPPPVPQASTNKAADELASGKTIDGRYEIQNILGIGAMGSVFLVKHLRLNKPFALKVVNPDLSRQPEFVARFKREADACSRLAHPNCISVTDFGHTDAGMLYLVMEFVDGVALSDIAKNTLVSFTDALEYTRQILVGLEHAHGKGLIHRDIKMENVLRCNRKNQDIFIKILDFGMAKPLVDASKAESITQGKIVLGTPQYLAPELVRDEKADERSDLYSVGICLYRMVTGKIVFQGETMLDALAVKVHKPAPSLKDATSLEYPEALESFVRKALRRNPKNRFQSATEMLEELELVKTIIDRDGSPVNPEIDTGTEKRVFIGISIALAILTIVVFLTKGFLFFDVRVPNAGSPKSTAATSAAMGAPLVKAAENTAAEKQKVIESEKQDMHPLLLETKILIEKKRCHAALAKLKSSIETLGNHGATGHYLLGRSSMCLGKPKDALAEYTQAIELDDRYRKDGIIVADAKKMLSAKRVRQDAIDFLKNVLGDAATPTFIYLAGHHDNMDVRHQALAHVESAGMLEHVDMVVSLEKDFYDTGSCWEKRKIVAKLGEIGTSRAKKFLRRAKNAEKRVGLFRKEYVYPCVRGDIVKALSAPPKKKSNTGR